MIHQRLLFAVLIVLFNVLGTDQTRAQDSIKDLAARASGELQVLTAFRNMERAVNHLDHFLTYGIIASQGGWGVVEFVDTTDYTNAYAIRSIGGDVQVDAARANAAIQRSKHATAEQKERARNALDALKTMLAATPKIADAITAEDFDLARAIYRSECQNAQSIAIIETVAGALEFEKLLGKTILSMRIAK